VFEPTSFLYAFDADAGIATLTLNRPERLNALTFETYDELRRAFTALSDEGGVRVIVITGSGRAFCSGGDVEDIIGALFARDFRGLLEFTRMTCDVVRAIRACRRPVIGALNGTVAGAGAVIATACDLRVRRSPTSSPAWGCPAPTWAPPGCCRASWGWPRRPSCS